MNDDLYATGTLPHAAPPTTGLAVFDLDGTLIRGDSLLPFLLTYGFRHRRHWGLFRGAGDLALYGARLLSDRFAKESLLRRVLGGEPLARIHTHAERFARGWATRRLHPVGVERLREHQRRGDRIILLSASPDLYVPMIARQLGIEEIVSTRVEVVAGQCTGRILGDNCKGTAKLTMLKAFLGTADAPPGAHAYGDSSSDLPVLNWVANGNLVTRRGLRPVPAVAADRSV